LPVRASFPEEGKVKYVWKKIRGGVTAPAGFRAGGTSCGIKDSLKKDLALVVSDSPAAWSALLTTSAAPAAPVQRTKKQLRAGKRISALLVNSGNANAATGEEGMRRAGVTAAAAAELLGLKEHEVVVASTGIIGRPLPVEKIRKGLPALKSGLSRRGGRGAAEAIMTTDTVAKEESFELQAGKRTIRIGGMAKGAGMIDPRMATMLAFITTDAAVSARCLKGMLREAADRSFNRITVDGDMSTNDTLMIMANGASGAQIREGSPLETALADGVGAVCRRLAEKVVLDGEGATKLLEVEVRGARSGADALKAARAVANSNLVKTAVYGGDLNWGRFLAALGYSGARLEVGRISISVNGHPAVSGGVEVPPGQSGGARRAMRARRIALVIDLGLGSARDTVLTCDLTTDYVKENAFYTT
jgi:glutamate N-acetyltransferase/amino-acid N-acetyltransferase